MYSGTEESMWYTQEKRVVWDGNPQRRVHLLSETYSIWKDNIRIGNERESVLSLSLSLSLSHARTLK
jgi:hypothetical protein